MRRLTQIDRIDIIRLLRKISPLQETDMRYIVAVGKLIALPAIQLKCGLMEQYKTWIDASGEWR